MKDKERDQMAEPARRLKAVTEEFDPFSLDDSREYSPDEIITRTVDAKGHKETMHVPFPPAIYGRIHELIAQRVIPQYRSPQDFVRDAVAHRLHYIAEKIKSESLERLVDYEAMLAQVESQEKEMNNLQNIVAKTASMLESAYNTRDEAALRDSLVNAVSAAGIIRAPYSTQVEALIESFQKKLDDL